MDPLLFISSKTLKLKPIEQYTFITILSNFILSQSRNLCYFFMFLNFILNSDILSLILPLSVLLYSLLSSPNPSKVYWQILTFYMSAVILAKTIYQLPIFCGSPAFSIFSIDRCDLQIIPAEVLINRIDQIIGIHKYSGPASYPQD